MSHETFCETFQGWEAASQVALKDAFGDYNHFSRAFDRINFCPSEEVMPTESPDSYRQSPALYSEPEVTYRQVRSDDILDKVLSEAEAILDQAVKSISAVPESRSDNLDSVLVVLRSFHRSAVALRTRSRKGKRGYVINDRSFRLQTIVAPSR